MSNSLNDSIRILRNLRGYKQSFMAVKLGITQQAYSHLENSERNISAETMKQICKILDASEDFILQFNPRLLMDLVNQKHIDIGNTENLLRDNSKVTDENPGVIKADIEELREDIFELYQQNQELNSIIKEQQDIIKNLNLTLLKRHKVVI